MKYRKNIRRYPAYPNAADKSYFARKAVDAAVMAVSCVGFVVSMLLLVVLI